MKCDELKSLKNIGLSFDTTTLHKQVIAEDSEGNCYGFDSLEEVYLKSEADKEIDFWKNESHKHYESWFNLNKQYEGWFGKVMRCERAERELRHHKYKRCLDNAWGCRQRMELFHELVLEEARTIALPNEVALKEYRRKRERAAKWRKRWMELAEQFKDKEA